MTPHISSTAPIDQPQPEPVKYSFPSLIEAIIDSNRAHETAQIVKNAQTQRNTHLEESSAPQRFEHGRASGPTSPITSTKPIATSGHDTSPPPLSALSLEEARLKQQRSADQYIAKFETTAQKVISHSSLTREEKNKWFEWHIEHQYHLSEIYHDKGPQYKARAAAHIEEMLLHKLRELLK